MAPSQARVDALPAVAVLHNNGAKQWKLPERVRHLVLADAPSVVLVGANVLCLLLAALVINNGVLRRRYPHRSESPLRNRHQTADEVPLARSGLNHADLDHAVRKLGSFVDVKSDGLVQLYNEASAHAFDRHMGQTCGDIMSRDVVTVAFATDLDEARRVVGGFPRMAHAPVCQAADDSDALNDKGGLLPRANHGVLARGGIVRIVTSAVIA